MVTSVVVAGGSSERRDHLIRKVVGANVTSQSGAVYEKQKYPTMVKARRFSSKKAPSFLDVLSRSSSRR